MKTKIVYVLISNGKDQYVALQTLSLQTLKKRNRNSEVLTVMDSITYQKLKECSSRILSESTPVIVSDLPQEFDPMQRSRYLKTTLRKIIEGDFLFIDGDTLISDRLDEIDSAGAGADIAAVADGNRDHYKAGESDKILARCSSAGFSQMENELCFNSGVLFVRDTPSAHVFFQTWHDLWKESLNHGVPQDQPSLWETNRVLAHPIQELSGIWNCQFGSNGNSYNRYVRKAKILHYYNTLYHGRLLLSIIDQTMHKDKLNFVSSMFLLWPKSIVYMRRLALFIGRMKAHFA